MVSFSNYKNITIKVKKILNVKKNKKKYFKLDGPIDVPEIGLKVHFTKFKAAV